MARGNATHPSRWPLTPFSVLNYRITVGTLRFDLYRTGSWFVPPLRSNRAHVTRYMITSVFVEAPNRVEDSSQQPKTKIGCGYWARRADYGLFLYK